MIDFIGIGAQKSGTSWAYTCLYEHPEVCIPVKELHFFSRPRYTQGKEWYEAQFHSCKAGVQKGEWSTSYLYSPDAAQRIHKCYPDVKILAILRNPVDRAYSQYRNSIRSGEIDKDTTFESYSSSEPSVWQQGLYAEQLERYLRFFPKTQMCIMVYEDIKKDPVAFMRHIHEFLGIDPNFVASMVHAEVNVARTPRFVWLDRIMHHVSEFLRRHGLHRFVHAVRTSGLTDMLRSFNAVPRAPQANTRPFDEEAYKQRFVVDATKLSEILGRDMCTEWHLR